MTKTTRNSIQRILSLHLLALHLEVRPAATGLSQQRRSPPISPPTGRAGNIITAVQMNEGISDHKITDTPEVRKLKQNDENLQRKDSITRLSTARKALNPAIRNCIPRQRHLFLLNCSSEAKDDGGAGSKQALNSTHYVFLRHGNRISGKSLLNTLIVHTDEIKSTASTQRVQGEKLKPTPMMLGRQVLTNLARRCGSHHSYPRKANGPERITQSSYGTLGRGVYRPDKLTGNQDHPATDRYDEESWVMVLVCFQNKDSTSYGPREHRKLRVLDSKESWKDKGSSPEAISARHTEAATVGNGSSEKLDFHCEMNELFHHKPINLLSRLLDLEGEPTVYLEFEGVDDQQDIFGT
ncbi:hypothetical protein FDENT_9661 [Fusarium denticulatum]|uniref:Uncharacterized protein n=1 Tax=Fusarium denticulatum TaxID=48507 RepID=A0A8H5WYI9_9HYPO|nr:hypothetical protein FDENT_9661 [Fusarium denticulatum]